MGKNWMRIEGSFVLFYVGHSRAFLPHSGVFAQKRFDAQVWRVGSLFIGLKYRSPSQVPG